MSRLTEWLARSLGPELSRRAEPVARWMSHERLDERSLEASVRGGTGAEPTGRRMMIERVRPAAVPAFLEAMGVQPSGPCATLARAAQTLDLPMIVGWDVARTPLVKLYANASDVSEATRERLLALAGLSGTGPDRAPHVVGVNVGPSALEWKLYAQSAGAPPEHEPLAAAFAPLLSRGLVSAWVVSRTVEEGRAPVRAVFAGLRAGHPAAPDAVAALPGWSAPSWDGVAPFGLGVVKSVGFGVADPSRWTVYFAPPGTAPVSWSLEPLFVAREPRAEIGVFVEPAALGRRAWATVAGHAISYRVRSGVADPTRVGRLMTWACERLGAGVDPSNLVRGAVPPEPWDVIELS